MDPLSTSFPKLAPSYGVAQLAWSPRVSVGWELVTGRACPVPVPRTSAGSLLWAASPVFRLRPSCRELWVRRESLTTQPTPLTFKKTKVRGGERVFNDVFLFARNKIFCFYFQPAACPPLGPSRCLQ